MNKDLLKRLCGTFGVSGYEGRVTDLIAEEIKGLVDECYLDPMGNLIAHKKGPGKKLMAIAHTDQIGLMVTEIEESGAVKFNKVGGIDYRNLLSDRVIFPNGTIGTVGCYKPKPTGDIPMERMFVDIGAASREEALEYVKPGDPFTFYAPCMIDEKKAISPALDNRIGCVIAIEALRMAKNIPYDLYLVFSVQEEVGLRGAEAAANAIHPDYAINLDTARAYYPAPGEKTQIAVGGGAIIDIKNGAVICAPAMVDHLAECADARHIKYQYGVGDAGGIDVAVIQRSGTGVVVGAISVASRHLHSMSEVELFEDIEACISLAAAAFETEF